MQDCRTSSFRSILGRVRGVERGQVGTVIERLDQGRVLVEFSNTEGKTQAVLPIKRSRLFVLHETVTMEAERSTDP